MKSVGRKVYAFDDVLIVPKYSDVKSRYGEDIQLQSALGTRLPLVSAPMDTVSGIEMCHKLHELGGLGVLHRHCSIEQQITWVKELKTLMVPFYVAIGATGDAHERLKALID